MNALVVPPSCPRLLCVNTAWSDCVNSTSSRSIVTRTLFPNLPAAISQRSHSTLTSLGSLVRVHPLRDGQAMVSAPAFSWLQHRASRPMGVPGRTADHLRRQL